MRRNENTAKLVERVEAKLQDAAFMARLRALIARELAVLKRLA